MWRGLSSCSVIRELAQHQFAGFGTLFVVVSTSVPAIELCSKFASEAEVLFPPNSHFKVNALMPLSQLQVLCVVAQSGQCLNAWRAGDGQ